MRPLIQSLREALLPSICQGDGALFESDAGSSSGTTRIQGLGKGICVRMAPPSGSGAPLNRWLFPLFDVGVPDLSRMCDYILFCPRERDERLVVLLCELKSGSVAGALQQLRGGMILAEYVINVTLLHHRPTIMPRTIEYRGVIFWQGAKVQKHSTRPGAGIDFWTDARTGLPYAHQRSDRSYSLDTFCMNATPGATRVHRSDPCVPVSP